nr:immunoglobulin light chain junction region [Macaca mulatta]
EYYCLLYYTGIVLF